MRKLTFKQEWVLGYLKIVTCASEHKLAKEWAKLTRSSNKPTMWDSFNMHQTLLSLIKRCLVLMERNPTSGFRYYSLL